MPREERTDVLVVGAGPVGMLTALILSQSGVQVQIIDEDSRTASRAYACALHPATLKLLDRLGLARPILESGQRVDGVAFYEGEKRRGEAKFSRLSTEFPSVVVVAQSAFEHLLEEKLKKDANLPVQWNHRLAAYRPDGPTAVATVETLAVSAKGYIIPEMDWSVQKSGATRADYVVGCDGPNSSVAHALNPGFEKRGEPEFFAVYEFQSNWQSGDELRVVLDQGVTSVLWPLPNKKFRWSFQLREEHLRDFPHKERSSVVIGDPELDRANRAFMQKLIRERAPWFKGDIEELGWSADVEFEHRYARRFGRGHGWLAGDSAHQTGPAGMQSMNVGVLEAEQLSAALVSILRNRAPVNILETYNENCVERWQRLLGFKDAPKPRPKTDPWTKDHSARILSCIPASGEDLAHLLDQLQLDWPG